LAKFVAAQHAEVFQAGADTAVGAALGVNAAKGYALTTHPYWNTIAAVVKLSELD
jgi:hypothetical protein